MIDSYKVGLKIYEYRKNLQMTQDDLANQLNITRQALSKWENGTSLPSIDLLYSLCKTFKTGFEDLLCLNDNTTADDPHNLFKDHDRRFIINKIIRNELKVDIPDVFYQFSPSERMMVLKAIKEKKIACNLFNLKLRLTPSEQKFLFNKISIGGFKK
ncbi:MAG: helix-turn-helix transcriptional regulator [Bacilli bacterium]